MWDLNMILKMAGFMLFIDLWTLFLYILEKKTGFGKANRFLRQFIIGLFFGGLAVLATHFSIPYEDTTVSVRDLAPLCAGLMFGPGAGIIAGLIGGGERLFAGIYWGIGSYAMIACAASTAAAGIVAAILRVFLFDNKPPSFPYSFAIGGVAEVFLMLMIFLTHIKDVDGSYALVKVCAVPMIAFHAVGLMIASLEVTAVDKLMRRKEQA